jgi:hypothetical protein
MATFSKNLIARIEKDIRDNPLKVGELRPISRMRPYAIAMEASCGGLQPVFAHVISGQTVYFYHHNPTDTVG